MAANALLMGFVLQTFFFWLVSGFFQLPASLRDGVYCYNTGGLGTIRRPPVHKKLHRKNLEADPRRQ